MSATAAAVRTLSVALAGNPNSGKTTLFNALTGLRQKIANYPGVTVERKTGRCQLDVGGPCEVIDLPGTYSLVATSPDEVVTRDVLRGLRADTPAPDVIVAVVDASNLPRNLYLVSQLLDLNLPLVVALNMSDIAERRGAPVDAQALAAALGVAVVPVVGHRRDGIRELISAIADAAVAEAVSDGQARPQRPAWPLPEALWEEVRRLGRELALSSSGEAADIHLDRARRLLVGDPAPDLAGLRTDATVVAEVERAHARLASLGIEAMASDIEARYRWIDAVSARVVRPAPPGPTLSERVDAVLIHRFFGLIVFLTVMAALFSSIFWLAAPLMDAINAGISWLGKALPDWLGLAPAAGAAPGALHSLIQDGIVAGVGAVVVFVPQVAILFLFLAVLEDSGYLARAAFLMDRLLAKVGLHGKSFIPLLSSFACAIPGIMATRTISSWRERLATIMVAPFMSCSARLPVYGLLVGTFFGHLPFWAQGLITLGCYVLGILAAVVTSLTMKLLTARREPPSPFLLELPTYKLPQVSQVARTTWSNTATFLTKAGTTIFCLSVLLWALAYYPRAPLAYLDEVQTHAEAQARATLAVTPAAAPVIAPVPSHPVAAEPQADPVAEAGAHARAQAAREYSLAGRLGKLIEPAIAPLGFDWKIGVGLIGAFAAREVFNSYLGIIYSVGEVEDDDAGRATLGNALLADRRADGTPVWTPLVAVSVLVWFVLAMQCISTTAVVRRETGGWRWPLIQLVGMNTLAYIVCLALYQIGSRL